MKFNSGISVSIVLLLVCACFGLIVNSGCNSSTIADNQAETPAKKALDADEELVFPIVEKSPDKSHEIFYGHHGKHFHAGEKIKPAVAILKDKKPLGNAVVSAGLVGDDGTVTNYVDSIYHAETAEERGHYANAELAIPNDAAELKIRYRVVLENGKEFERDVTISVESRE